jgi:serine/threonine-protein kinase
VAEVPAVIGRYQIRDRIGQGGMGSLYVGWDPMLERQIAIKLLRDDSDELRERFAREARAVARLRHRNIVTIFDVGEQDGHPFIAMEYIHGETLAELIRTPSALSTARKLQLMEELCDGLGFAHKAGIVHRDVKPANVMVEHDGVVKILDFGIARIAESGMTQAGMLIGTLNYMSPEQVAGQVVDRRSDIFAVGAVLYELLSGRQAFPGGLHNGILNRILHEPPPSLHGLCPDLDPVIVDIAERALEKLPQARYADLTTMRQDLQRMRQRLDLQSPAPAAVADTDAETLAIEPPAVGRDAHTPRRSAEREELARRRAVQIGAHVDDARRALAAADFDAAIAAADHALFLDPEDTSAVQIIDEARAALDERRLQRLLNEGEARLLAGALTEALALADQAVTLAPVSAAALALRQGVDRARAERRQRERDAAAQQALERAEALLEAGSLDEAEAAAAEAVRLSPGLPAAVSLQQQAREQRQQREVEALEQRVKSAIVEADRLFRSDADEEALALLRAFEPRNDQIGAALERLEAEHERRARERREVQRRAEKIAAVIVAAEQAESHEAAVGLLEEALRIDPQHIEVRRLLDLRRTARDEELRRARERRQKVAAAVTRAKEMAAHAEAIATLEAVQALDLEGGEVERLLAERRAALAREEEAARRAREVAEKIGAAIVAAERASSHEDAVGILEAALRIDPQHIEVRRLLDLRRTARDEEVRRARERRQRVAAAVTRATEIASHAEAIATLEAVQTLDTEGEVQRLLADRRAALAREEENARRAREREAAIASALARAEQTASHQQAIKILEGALTLDQSNSSVQQLLALRREARQNELEEERRQNERREGIARALERARRARSDDESIAILTEALALDPSHAELRAAIQTREHARQHAREQAARQQQIEAARQSILALIGDSRLQAASEALETAEAAHTPTPFRDVRRRLARATARTSHRRAAAGAPAIATPTVAVWAARLRKDVPPRWGAAAAILLVLLAAAGYFLARSPFDRSATVTNVPVQPPPAEEASSGAVPLTNPAEKAQPTTPAGESTNTGSIEGAGTPPPSAAPQEPVVAAIRAARQQVARGNVRQALPTATRGLIADPQNRELLALVTDIATRSRQQAIAAQSSARRFGDLADAQTAYREGQAKLTEAQGHERAGRYERAAPLLWEAADLFARAERDASEAQARLAAAAAPPPTRPASPATESATPAAASPVAPPPTPPAAASASAPTATAAPAPAPAQPGPPAPAPPPVSDETAIRATLRAYEEAYVALDIAAVKRIYPSINEAALARSFRDLISQQVRIEAEQISITGTTAMVVGQVRQSFTPRAGSGRSDVIKSVFRLQKVGDRWVIVERR